MSEVDREPRRVVVDSLSTLFHGLRDRDDDRIGRDLDLASRDRLRSRSAGRVRGAEPHANEPQRPHLAWGSVADAIRVVVRLYEDRVLEKPEGYDHAFPDLLAFHDAPTVIEQRLFQMFLKHRMRAFQGTFHANPDYALWYGWSEMQRDLTDIKELAEEMRHAKAHGHAEAEQSARN